jgi:hypothetical protein
MGTGRGGGTLGICSPSPVYLDKIKIVKKGNVPNSNSKREKKT